MKTIHKYVLPQPVNDVVTHDGAEFLAAAEQYGQITIWAEVDTSKPKKVRTVHVVGTGGQVPPRLDYLGTVLLADGEYVFHVYADSAQRKPLVL